MASELAWKGLNILLRQNDARFKLHQRLDNLVLNERVAKSYLPFQELESKQLLFDLLGTAGGSGIDCHGHVERATASTVYNLLYGHRIRTLNDPIMRTARTLTHELEHMLEPGKYLVDSFPVLNILPQFLAPWKTEAARHWQQQRTMHVTELQRGLDENGWNLCKHMQQVMNDQKMDWSVEELAFEIGGLANAALEASTETTMWFLVACVTDDYDRSWIAKAQEQLDAVVGRDRFPTFEDRPKLPYIHAILEEVLRWRPAVAGGVPHFTKVESSYEGHRIPSNSVVMANHYALAREEGVFGLKYDVDAFVPDRWLQSGERQLPIVGFGYGRRICPGRHVARNSLWIAIARILWAFDVKPGLSETGERIVVHSTNGTNDIINKPFRFKARFEPRGPWVQELITRDGNPHNVDHLAMLDQVRASLAAK